MLMLQTYKTSESVLKTELRLVILAITVSHIVRAIVVAVGVGDDDEAGEVVLRTKNRPVCHSLTSVPDGKAVAKEILGGARNLKMDLHLPIPHEDRLMRENNKLHSERIGSDDKHK